MNVPATGGLRKWLFVGMLSCALAFSSACSAPQAVSQPQFTAIPPPGQDGTSGTNYVAILGPASGSGSETFTVAARTGMAAWLGCIGKGVAWIKGPITVAAACSDGGTWAGGVTQPTHLRAGQKVSMRVVAPATTRWEFRIDGTPQAS
jgi:hypothetical protein